MNVTIKSRLEVDRGCGWAFKIDKNNSETVSSANTTNDIQLAEIELLNEMISNSVTGEIVRVTTDSMVMMKLLESRIFELARQDFQNSNHQQAWIDLFDKIKKRRIIPHYTTKNRKGSVIAELRDEIKKEIAEITEIKVCADESK